MKKKIIILAAILTALVSNRVYGQEQYRVEISTTYQRIESSDSRETFMIAQEPNDNKTIAYGFTGEIFFAPVSTGGHPYAEAAFLERVGSTFYSWQDIDFKSGIRHGTGSEQQLLINLAKPGFPLAISAAFEESKLYFHDPDEGETIKYRPGLSIAGYFTNSFLAGIDLEYNYQEIKNMIDINPDMFFLNTQTLDYGIFEKYVHELKDGKSVSVQARIGQTKSVHSARPLDTVESVSIIYYWTRRFSTGIAFENVSTQSAADPGRNLSESLAIPGGRRYTANLEYFVTPRLSITGSYDRFELLDNNPGFGDANTFNVTLAGRF